MGPGEAGVNLDLGPEPPEVGIGQQGPLPVLAFIHLTLSVTVLPTCSICLSSQQTLGWFAVMMHRCAK